MLPQCGTFKSLAGVLGLGGQGLGWKLPQSTLGSYSPSPSLLQHIPLPGDQSHQMICGQSDLRLVRDDLKGRLWAHEV